MPESVDFYALIFLGQYEIILLPAILCINADLQEYGRYKYI